MSVLEKNLDMNSALCYNKNISYASGEKEEYHKNIKTLLGRNLLEKEIYNLGMAPSRSSILIGSTNNGVFMDVMEPQCLGLLSFIRIQKNSNNQIVLFLDDFQILRFHYRQQGIGTKLFRRFIETAQAVGISYIQSFSRRSRSENGYYTLPRWGFNNFLPKLFLDKLPNIFADVRSLHDMMRTKEGRIYWRLYGFCFPIFFDLKPNSQSLNVFYDYLQSEKRTIYKIPRQ